MKAPDHTLATVAQLAEFDTIIDVRSPAEYAEDHIPGAINCPVLDDEERIRAAGAAAYVSKPISLARFMETVNGLL